MKNENLKKEFQELNKDIHNENNNLQLQNEKIHELKGKLKDVDEKSKITQKYTSGFNSIFGFFPKLFSWNTKKGNSIPEQNKDDKSNQDSKKNTYNINNIDKEESDEDELEKEIKFLNQNAKNIKNSIDLSIKGTEELTKQIDKTATKVQNNKKSAEKYFN